MSYSGSGEFQEGSRKEVGDDDVTVRGEEMDPDPDFRRVASGSWRRDGGDRRWEDWNDIFLAGWLGDAKRRIGSCGRGSRPHHQRFSSFSRGALSSRVARDRALGRGQMRTRGSKEGSDRTHPGS